MKETTASESRKSVKITLDEDHSRFGIYGYHPGNPGEIIVIRPNEAFDASDDNFGNKTLKTETFNHSLIITPHALINDWTPRTIDELEAQHFEVLNPRPPQIMLLGTGTAQHWPSPQILASLTNQGIAVEVMDTAAACRTFAILASDGRDVGAALLIA